MAVFILGLFYVAAFICFFMGLFLLLINMESLLNKLAFLFCISLSCWCFGSGNTINAVNISDAMVWKRFAAIGVGTFYGFFLHYVILLTEQEHLLKYIWGKVGIYLPSVFIVYFFALSEKTTAFIYQLVKMKIGWVNISSLNIFLILFDIYICVYLLFSVYLVLSWKKRTSDVTKRKMADFVMITYCFAFFSSVLVQVLDAVWFHSYLHVLGPLTLLLPMLTAVYGIKKFNFMQSVETSEENLFMEQFRTKIIRYLSDAFFIGAFIFLLLDARDGSFGSFFKSIVFALFLCLFGLCIFVIQKNVKRKEWKLIFHALILSLAIPVITLKFEPTASITVWAFPFVLVLAALLFYSRTVLIMLSVSMILTQMYLWIKVPYAMVAVDTRDYVARIGLMGMAICLVYYINQIYISRLKQLSDKIKVQDLLFQISAQIINTTNQNLDEKMEEVLELLCQYLNADRAHIYYRIRKCETEQADYVCWCTQESKLNGDALRDIRISEFPWWKRQVREHGLVQTESVEHLSYEAKEEQNFLMK